MPTVATLFRRLALGATSLGLLSGCDGSGTTAPPKPLNVAGSWTGTETDRLGPALLSWTLVQSASSVSGTVVMRPVDPSDGSCGSCHKNKVGTVGGFVSGTTLRLSMFFPAGAAGDPTPACSITLNGMVPSAATSVIAGTYSGSDPCEGTFDGTLTMSRKP